MTRHYDPADAEQLRDIIIGHTQTIITVTGETVATGRRDQTLVPFYNTARLAALHTMRGSDAELDIVRMQLITDRNYTRLMDAIQKAEERARFR
jgi:hypothetical protein